MSVVLVHTNFAEEVRQAFLSHLEETNGQVQRLEQIFTMLQKNPKGKTCVGMKGVLEEGSEVLKDIGRGVVRDARWTPCRYHVDQLELKLEELESDLGKLLACGLVLDCLVGDDLLNEFVSCLISGAKSSPSEGSKALKCQTTLKVSGILSRCSTGLHLDCEACRRSRDSTLPMD